MPNPVRRASGITTACGSNLAYIDEGNLTKLAHELWIASIL